MFTRNGKALTAKGIKPICVFQQVFKATWLFGAYSPFTGDHFELELPHCNSNNFQLFLNEFSKERPDEFKIIILDNGAFHKSKTLTIPNNMRYFLSHHIHQNSSLRKNMVAMKRAFTGKLHKSLEEVSSFIENEVKKLTNEIVKKPVN